MRAGGRVRGGGGYAGPLCQHAARPLHLLRGSAPDDSVYV